MQHLQVDMNSTKLVWKRIMVALDKRQMGDPAANQTHEHQQNMQSEQFSV